MRPLCRLLTWGRSSHSRKASRVFVAFACVAPVWLAAQARGEVPIKRLKEVSPEVGAGNGGGGEPGVRRPHCAVFAANGAPASSVYDAFAAFCWFENSARHFSGLPGNGGLEMGLCWSCEAKIAPS